MLTHGSLFAGIGGFDLGFERAGIRTVWQVEIDAYCRRVLAKHFPDAERFSDIRECGARNLPPVDILSGGFPCQDISNAGKRAGIDGERSGLWSEYARIIRELRPRYVVVENVAALLGRGMERVLGDLAACGYDAEWESIRASDVGAPHRRERIWIVAYPNGREQGRRVFAEREQDWRDADFARHGAEGTVAYAGREGQPRGGNGRGRGSQSREICDERSDWWAVGAEFRGMVDGLSKGLDELDEKIVSHYTMGYGTTTNSRQVKEVQAMREASTAEKVRWEAGGPLGFSETGILRPSVHGIFSVEPVPIQSFLETLSEEELRTLWERAISWRSPCRRGSQQQSAGEPNHILRDLSHAFALGKWQTACALVLRLREVFDWLGIVRDSPNTAKEVWESISQAEKDWASLATLLGPFHSEWPDVPRVAKGIISRVDRLRGLGNAIVPQIAEWIGHRIVEVHSRGKT